MRVISIDFEGDQTKIILFVSKDITKTRQLPGFVEAVLESMPELRFHKCENDRNLTFADELFDTEIAHVFEHVLLEIIGQIDTKAYRIKGWTNWDWKNSPRWTYEISLRYRDSRVVFNALSRALTMFDVLIDTCRVKEVASELATVSGAVGGEKK